MSSFLWGYWVTQLPGAIICCYFGASKIFGIGLTISIVATFLNPLFSNINLWLFVSLRILIGLGQGVTFPVALNIITNWAPIQEKGLFTALSSGGQYLGAVLANAISGVLADSNFLGGWPGLFYVYGTVGVVWAVLWFLLVRDSPDKSQCVSSAEREYLAASTAPTRKMLISDIPWRGILTCRPFWSTVLIHTCNGYGYFMLLSDLPKFMVEVLEYDIKKSGFVASVPYIAIWLGYTSSGWLSDKLISSGTLSKTSTRKFCGIGAMFIPAILLFSLTYLEHNVPILIFMNIAMFFQGFANSCYYVNYMDLSPRFSAVLCGVGNGMCAASGLLGPVLVGLLINGVDKDDHVKLHHQWQTAFISASVVWMFGAVQYCVFGSAVLQSWNGDEKKEEEEEEEEEEAYLDANI